MCLSYIGWSRLCMYRSIYIYIFMYVCLKSLFYSGCLQFRSSTLQIFCRILDLQQFSITKGLDEDGAIVVALTVLYFNLNCELWLWVVIFHQKIPFTKYISITLAIVNSSL